jgi:hypothetical protein
MGNLSAVVQQLRTEHEQVQKEVQQIDAALSALGSLRSHGSHYTMSASARKKISLAQKARWAKQNANGSSESPKRTVSLASRRKMAAAQRARWAKVKSQKKAA